MAKKCGFTRKKCIEHDCQFWQLYRGTDPQTGQEIDKWECCIVMHNVMLLEVASKMRSVAAAAESQRNIVAAKIDDLIAHYKSAIPAMNVDVKALEEEK